MTDEQILTLWCSMRPAQGDPDPVAFARLVMAEHRDDLRAVAVGILRGRTAPTDDPLRREFVDKRQVPA